MGSCASAYRNSASSGKYRQSIVHSEAHNHLTSMPSTPVKHKPANVIVVDQSISSHAYRSQVSPWNSVASFSNNGSREEAFFDSQAWLESDCDDEFYSVNGDFTPSRGNTPLHGSRVGTPLRNPSPQANRVLFGGRPSSYSERNRSPRVSMSASPSAQHIDTLKLNDPSATPPLIEKKRKKLADLFRESIRERQEDLLNDNVVLGVKLEDPEQNKRTPALSKGNHSRSAQCCFPRVHSGRGLRKTPVAAAAPAIVVDA